MLLDWAQQLSAALAADQTPHTPHAADRAEPGLPVDEALLTTVLDLARDAAHAVERPAAPLTTFLVGYAAARRGGTPADLAACAEIARELASAWERGTEA
ncbi:DUF6457 domain-containing protein [Actinopolymorpha pittospori]|uniref:DUF6457 domain-containing protein n=1 Tax=Actinopolymorpha pittospori TaxID=648752 RepID=A0A927MTA5_9ACTN|nr:DUF6457 domain-containing protein [Actinopolymorpha pittospori]MBE1604868.1 hypothetical protein [Actinopolymorpha pittospori]